MVDELKPVARSQLIDRIRFGEKYLSYNLDDIAHTKSFSTSRDIKKILDQKRLSKKDREAGRDDVESESPYDNLSVPQDAPHDIDKLI